MLAFLCCQAWGVKSTSTSPLPPISCHYASNTRQFIQDNIFALIKTLLYFLGLQGVSFPCSLSSLCTKTKQRPMGLEHANSKASLLSHAPPSLPQGDEHCPHIIWDKNNIAQSLVKFSKYFPTSIAGCCLQAVNSCQVLPNSILLCLPKSLGEQTNFFLSHWFLQESICVYYIWMKNG